MISINAAIRYANDNAAMVHVAPKTWAIREYDAKRNAWIEGPGMPYSKALQYYAETRHAAALIAMGWDKWDATCEAGANHHGALRVRLARSLEQ